MISIKQLAKKVPVKKFAKKLNKRKVIAGAIIFVVIVIALVLTAIFMDSNTITLINSNEDAGNIYGGGRALSGNTLTIRADARPGYVFTNWTNANGTVASTERIHALEMPQSDLKLTANWSTITYSINLHIDSDTNTTVFPETFEVTSDTIYIEKPTKEGYTFLGWYKDASFTTVAEDVIPAGSTQNVELFARWSPSYNIEYFIQDVQTGIKYPMDTNVLTHVRASNNPENPDTYTAEMSVTLQSPVLYEIDSTGLTGGTYQFLGWYLDSQRITIIDKNWANHIEIVAKWNSNEKQYYAISKEDDSTYIQLGYYPNHILDDERINNEIKAKIASGELAADPVTGWYIYNNVRYAMQKANPYYNHYYFSDGRSVVKDEDYFFTVEPIKWRVVNGDVDKKGDRLTLISEDIIYAGTFSEKTIVSTHNGKATYSNNWEYSNLRKWLNEVFYASAFMSGEANFIQTTMIDYSAETAHFDAFSNGSYCDDKVYVFSYADASNTEYGWRYFTREDGRRMAKTTDYARAVGAYSSINGGKEKNCGAWWLRSAGDQEYSASVVSALGAIGTWNVDSSCIGIRPSIDVKLN